MFFCTAWCTLQGFDVVIIIKIHVYTFKAAYEYISLDSSFTVKR